MNLSGRKLHALSGALTIFRCVPLPNDPKPRLSRRDQTRLDRLEQRVKDLREHLRSKHRAIEVRSQRIDAIKKEHLALSLNPGDGALLAKVLVPVVHSSRRGPTLNPYFNGDEYGVTHEDFESLLDAAKSEVRQVSDPKDRSSPDSGTARK